MKEKVEEKGITKSEMIELLSISKSEMVKLISEQFAVVFEQIDSSAESLRSEFKVELKNEVGELRKDMNNRFSSVEKRLSSIENNMVYNYEHEALAKRVKKLETVNA